MKPTSRIPAPSARANRTALSFVLARMETSTSTTERLVQQFLDCTLPKSEWTHVAHLRVGLWHVRSFPPDEALARVREGILRLNAAHGTPNTDTGGYHETITRFYLLSIDRFLANADPHGTRSLDDLVAQLIA